MNVDQLSFTKACGLGNDFVILPLPIKTVDLSKLSIALADRRYGIGCDQIIFTEEAPFKKTYKIRFFNSDGSEAEGCGNGSRCVARLLMDERGWECVKLETAGGMLDCQKKSENTVSIQMPNPQWEKNVPIYDDIIKKAFYITIGNPHLVCFVGDIDDVKTKGSIFETYLHQINDRFPERVNVGFAQVMDRKNIALNVWERGAGLTPACGTGACAAAVAACLEDFTDKSVIVHQKGGALKIHWAEDGLFMSGEALTIYQGSISLNLLNGRIG